MTGATIARIYNDRWQIELLFKACKQNLRVKLDCHCNRSGWYHCAEHMHETARAQFGDGILEAQEWAEAALARLCLNELGRTVGGLRRMQPRNAAAEESIRKLMGYLEGQ